MRSQFATSKPEADADSSFALTADVSGDHLYRDTDPIPIENLAYSYRNGWLSCGDVAVLVTPLLTSRALVVLRSELVWVWLPALVIMLTGLGLRRWLLPRRPPSYTHVR